ncbi:COG3359 Predicted exonuclease [uncultured Caudovirales phage]|uniref:COG3359 Predicted exonuclease n=1 Tax=uncultured Caudovirales phage TaxID=2100421 RepID=A0A6J5N8C2_9CAUD|nr:COG3359 Predicted exonuclease [uncultured Caudovirales phage]
MRKRLFFDIETSFNIGIFWRSGYNLTIQPDDIIKERAIICVSWKWEDDDKVYNLTWDNKQCDKKLLKDFIKVLNTADEIIAHNGDRFDIKWLRTRCLYHGVEMFPQYQSIDTLKHSKSQFNFNSNKLDYIAKFLGVGAKLKHEGMDMWKEIIFNKDADALKRMVEYCDMDVLVLEKVFHKIQPYTKHKINYSVLRGGDKFGCPECQSNNVRLRNTYTTPAGTIQHYMSCNNCHKNSFKINNKTFMDFLQYKMKNNL